MVLLINANKRINKLIEKNKKKYQKKSLIRPALLPQKELINLYKKKKKKSLIIPPPSSSGAKLSSPSVTVQPLIASCVQQAAILFSLSCTTSQVQHF